MTAGLFLGAPLPTVPSPWLQQDHNGLWSGPLALPHHLLMQRQQPQRMPLVAANLHPMVNKQFFHGY